jgi:acyl transferase domain-containing protein
MLADRPRLENMTGTSQVGEFPTLVGNGADFLATRTAYKLDLRGPAFTVQSARSTSLLAVAEACQLSRRYGARGRRLDHQPWPTATIRAVIRGSAVNNDGARKVGYMAPSSDGQAKVIALAHAVADITADSISHVECHGTATPLGDPIEIAGLAKAFGATTDRKGFCAIGTVKTNIGHLDIASGVAGLIKTILALEHESLPVTLHFKTANPKLGLEDSPFCVNAELRPWPRGAKPRIAGVNAAGVGGTNVHLIVEEAPSIPAASAPDDGGTTSVCPVGPRRQCLGGSPWPPRGTSRNARGTEHRRQRLHLANRQARFRQAVRRGRQGQARLDRKT